MNLFVRCSNKNQKANLIAKVLVCSILLVLPGCGIPCLRPSEPARELPVTFNGEVSGENSSQLSVEEFFNDPTLTMLVDDGINGNQQLKILAEEIQIAYNEWYKRTGAYLPFLSFGAGAGIAKPSIFTPSGAVEDQLQFRPGQNFPSPLPDFLVAANFSWQLDIWRQLRNARDAQGLRYLGTAEGRNYVITRLVAEIAENYYGLMALDKRLETLDRTIALQEQSLKIAESQKENVRGTELGVQRFRAEIRKNQSEKLIVAQEIIEVENRINFLVGRFPETVERNPANFFDLNLHALSLGVPAELLQNRPDIRQAERELEAAGLDISVARANFYPRLVLNAGVGFEAFNTRYLLNSPESLIYNVAGDLVAPLINRRGIRADYMTANSKQLQALYDYQRTVLNAFTEVINRISAVRNYSRSIELKKEQLDALEKSVEVATKLFQNARAEYIDVLFAQRDYNEARLVLIDTKRKQLSAIVNTYQALGGGLRQVGMPSEVVYISDEPVLPSPTDEDPTAIPPTPEQADADKPANDNK